MKGWRLQCSPGCVDVYRDSPDLGEVLVGSLYLNAADIAELREIFSDRPA